MSDKLSVRLLRRIGLVTIDRLEGVREDLKISTMKLKKVNRAKHILTLELQELKAKIKGSYPTSGDTVKIKGTIVKYPSFSANKPLKEHYGIREGVTTKVYPRVHDRV